MNSSNMLNVVSYRKPYKALQCSYDHVTSNLTMYINIKDVMVPCGVYNESTNKFKLLRVTYENRQNFTYNFEQVHSYITSVPKDNPLHKQLKNFVLSGVKICALELYLLYVNNYVGYYTDVLNIEKPVTDMYSILHNLRNGMTKQEAALQVINMCDDYQQTNISFHHDNPKKSINLIVCLLKTKVIDAIMDLYNDLYAKSNKLYKNLEKNYDMDFSEIITYMNTCVNCKQARMYHINNECGHGLCVQCAYVSVKNQRCVVCAERENNMTGFEARQLRREQNKRDKADAPCNQRNYINNQMEAINKIINEENREEPQPLLPVLTETELNDYLLPLEKQNNVADYISSAIELSAQADPDDNDDDTTDDSSDESDDENILNENISSEINENILSENILLNENISSNKNITNNYNVPSCKIEPLDEDELPLRSDEMFVLQENLIVKTEQCDVCEDDDVKCLNPVVLPVSPVNNDANNDDVIILNESNAGFKPKLCSIVLATNSSNQFLLKRDKNNKIVRKRKFTSDYNPFVFDDVKHIKL
ncbi:unknown [Euproctis pseudoconspersa nucleopolyhedrovirus]|uniref:Hoar n=1 Tax=Euproctis pseudoconspersa nucleopolyhedrovirus TaxID=307467 RepID=C3TWR2_9ABAC|nr:hypothetical protein EupsNPV_gp004 [Euproctis pseudoconspersa nucleopolyhedrovirus]ACO53454.1 unknown [Euproctis pseudoconspersa nucleopolyhedrovirus]